MVEGSSLKILKKAQNLPKRLRRNWPTGQLSLLHDLLALGRRVNIWAESKTRGCFLNPYSF